MCGGGVDGVDTWPAGGGGDAHAPLTIILLPASRTSLYALLNQIGRAKIDLGAISIKSLSGGG